MPQAASNIHILFTEIYLMMFANLEPDEYVLLGLIYKQFYGYHWEKHGKVLLGSLEGKYLPRKQLGELLSEWSGPKLHFNLEVCYNTDVWQFHRTGMSEVLGSKTYS